MANAQRGEVAIDVGGVSYTLRITLNSMCALEDLLSTKDKPVTFGEAVARAERGSMGAIRAFIWCALLDQHPDMTLPRAGALIQEFGGLDAIGDVMKDVARGTSPDEADVQELGGTANPRKARAKKK